MNASPTVETLPGAATMPMPNFISMTQAELFKMTRQRAIWITGIITFAVMLLNELPYAFIIYGFHQSGAQDVTVEQSLTYGMMEVLLSIVRQYSGLFMMILAVIVIAQEYQQGTIRVLLARGVGRMRLLGAKLAALGVVGLIVLVGSVVLTGLAWLLDIQLGSGSLDLATHIPPYFWNDAGLYVVTLAINLVATVLFAATIAVIGRSLAFGLSIALTYFLIAESLVSTVLLIVFVETKNDIYERIPTFFLGTNLVNMPALLLPDRGLDIGRVLETGTAMNPFIDGTHTLLVTAGYCVVFLAVAFFLTYKRDVQQ